MKQHAGFTRRIDNMQPLFQVENLKKHYPVRATFFSRVGGVVKAVDDIDFNILENETLGLVGESGCGKTTVARLLLRIVEPTSGKIVFDGVDIMNAEEETLRKEIRPKMQIVFQDYSASLNPRKTIRQILSRPYQLQDIEFKEIDEKLYELLEAVGLDPPDIYIDRFPHEFSGGQRQRINFARALALNPIFIACDEPVSALDMSVRAQILLLMKQLKKDFNLTYLFITHDLSVVRSLCDRVAVMYLGNIVELGKTADIFNDPLHPYTSALLSATPIPNPTRARARQKFILEGDIPNPLDLPSGCKFHTRCVNAKPECSSKIPELIEVENGRKVACFI
jgi:oligopeptide/dipeptide ABC transporter ATP-binding protein